MRHAITSTLAPTNVEMRPIDTRHSASRKDDDVSR